MTVDDGRLIGRYVWAAVVRGDDVTEMVVWEVGSVVVLLEDVVTCDDVVIAVWSLEAVVVVVVEVAVVGLMVRLY